MPAPSTAFTVSDFIETLERLCANRSDVSRTKISQCLRGAGKYPRLRFELIAYCLGEIDPSYKFLDSLRLKLFEGTYRPRPNFYHRFLARALTAGHTVITTNFDCFIELALLERNLALLDKCSARLIKPHGTVQRYDRRGFRNSPPHGISTTIFDVAEGSDVSRYPSRLRKLVELISGRELIVLGYSGSDSFDIMPALYHSRPKKCVWYTYAPQRTLEPVNITATTPLLSDGVLSLCRHWEAQDVEVEVLAGNPALAFGQSLPLLPVVPRVELPSYDRDQLTYFLARLAMNQNDFAFARRAFKDTKRSSNAHIKDWSLNYETRVQKTWRAMGRVAVRNAAHIVSPRAKLATAYYALDSAAVLEQNHRFKQLYRTYQKQLRETAKVDARLATRFNGRSLHCLGNYFLNVGQPKRAENAFRSSLTLRRKAGEPADIFKAFYGISLSLLEQWKLREAKEIIDPMAEYCRQIDDAEQWVEFYHLQASYYLQTGELAASTQSIRKATKLITRRGDVEEIQCYMLLAQILCRQKKWRSARAILSKLLSISQSIGQRVTPIMLRTMLRQIDFPSRSRYREQLPVKNALRRAGLRRLGDS